MSCRIFITYQEGKSRLWLFNSDNYALSKTQIDAMKRLDFCENLTLFHALFTPNNRRPANIRHSPRQHDRIPLHRLAILGCVDICVIPAKAEPAPVQTGESGSFQMAQITRNRLRIAALDSRSLPPQGQALRRQGTGMTDEISNCPQNLKPETGLSTSILDSSLRSE